MMYRATILAYQQLSGTQVNAKQGHTSAVFMHSSSIDASCIALALMSTICIRKLEGNTTDCVSSKQ